MCQHYQRMYNAGTLDKLWEDLSKMWNRYVYEKNKATYEWMRPMTPVRMHFHATEHDRSNGLLELDEEIADIKVRDRCEHIAI